MDSHELKSHIDLGEAPGVEFKRCGTGPEHDTFETICAFANGFGGNVFLGVEDDGNVVGIAKGSALSIKRNIINVINNRNAFDPPTLLEFEEIVFEGKLVLRIWVPASPSIHSYKGKMYERIEDSDIVARTEPQITSLCIRKQGIYTEQRVFKYVSLEDLQTDLLSRIRIMATNKRSDHPWRSLSDIELLRSAGLFGKNYATDETGFNLAAVLLLGKDDVIRSLCPAYKTDAILRKDQIDRYDDRLIVKSNLIGAYDTLFGFCVKHLPDRFYLEGAVTTSPRDIIIREVISNMLVHREYTNPFPAKIIIDKECLSTENASRAMFDGRLTLNDFNPVPKNPLMASFFNQIGLAEELGSGTRNLYKYTSAYSGGIPFLKEGNVFKATIPIQATNQNPPTTSRSLSAAAAIRRISSQNGSVTVQDLEKEGIAKRTAQRELAAMSEQGMLKPKGQGRARYYVPTSL